MSFVGLDLGGTYLKAALLTSAGTTNEIRRRPMPAFLDISGVTRELDPQELAAAALDLLDEVTAGESLDGILISGQMAGTALIDASGMALAPIITWQDRRVPDVDPVVDRLGPAADAVFVHTGSELRAGLPIATLTSVQIPSNAYFTSLMGFVAGCLTESRASHLHTTDAAASGLFDVLSGRWSVAAMKAVGLSDKRMPSVSSDIVAAGWSTRFDCPVFCSVGDQQAALFGSGLKSGEVSINIATGGQVAVISGSTRTAAQLRPYFARQYLHTITHLPAGRMLTQALAEVGGRPPTSQDWAWAVESASLASPHMDRFRDVVSSIAHAYVSAVHVLAPEPNATIRFSGGVAQAFSPLQDLIVSALGMPFEVFDGDDAALAGLARLAQDIPR